MKEHVDQRRREAKKIARARGMPYIGGGEGLKGPPPLFEHTVRLHSPPSSPRAHCHANCFSPTSRFMWNLTIALTRRCCILCVFSLSTLRRLSSTTSSAPIAAFCSWHPLHSCGFWPLSSRGLIGDLSLPRDLQRERSASGTSGIGGGGADTRLRQAKGNLRESHKMHLQQAK